MESKEAQLSDYTTKLEQVTEELSSTKSDLADQEGRYELLKEKAQKKLHELKKQLDEKNSLLSSTEQVRSTSPLLVYVLRS